MGGLSRDSGDNLYSCSIVALDATTGARSWHFQFTPRPRNNTRTPASTAPGIQKLPSSCHSTTFGLAFQPESQAEMTWSLKYFARTGSNLNSCQGEG